MDEINLLYIDKSKIAQKLLTKGLEQIAHVTCASSCGDAEKLIEDNKFNFVILDYELPDGDGIGFATKLRDTPGYAKTPIILYTASLNNELEYRAMQAGINEGVAKPVDMFDMMQRVAAQIELPQIKKVRRELLQLSCFSWTAEGKHHEYSPDLGLLISGDDKIAIRQQMHAALEEQILAKEDPSQYPADIEVYKHVINVPPEQDQAA